MTKLETYDDVRKKVKSNRELFDTEKHLLSPRVREAVDSTFDICLFLVDKVEELDNKISKNSRNSSKPPSNDNKDEILPNQSLKRKSNKNPGGQEGHKGSHLKKISNPDDIVAHKPKGKCQCGQDLSVLDSRMEGSRQLFEVEILRKVIEHQIFKTTCKCGKEHCGQYPINLKAPTQYGESVRALVAYFNKYQLIPFERIEEMMGDIFGLPLSEGSVDNFSKYAEGSLELFKEEFFKNVNDLKYANVDESPTRVNKKKGYLHVFSNEFMTFLYYHAKRGMEAVNECGLLSKFKGTLVHDCFSMYFNYGRDHAICNAHLLRELIFIEEKYHYSWATKAKIFLFDLNDLVMWDKEDAEVLLDSIMKDKIRDSFYKILNDGRKECSSLIKDLNNKGKKRGKQHPALNLLNRMIKLKKDILRFMYDYDIPFTNNQAERDLRMSKVHLKISGGFRSERGAQNYALFRSYISTVKKHGLSVYEAIKNLYNPHENSTLKEIFKPYNPDTT